jgi:Domain of unknown function (DUF4499)/Protein of unknown function (DUF2470)
MSAAAFNEAFHNAVEFMNEERPQLVLLFVWNYFGKRSAQGARIVTMNQTGLTLSVRYTKERTRNPADEEVVHYNFPKPIENPKEISRTLGDLFNRYSSVCYPDPVVTIVMVALWVFLLLSVATDVDVDRYPYIRYLRNFAIKMISSQLATIALVFLILAHTFEGLYVGYLCQEKIDIAKSKVSSWIMMTLIMGYPTTSKAVQLAQIAEKAQKKKKN